MPSVRSVPMLALLIMSATIPAALALGQAYVQVQIGPYMRAEVCIAEGTITPIGTFLLKNASCASSIHFDQTSPGKSASTNGESPTGIGVASNSTAGGEDRIQFLVIRNLGNVDLDIAVESFDPDPKRDQNSDGIIDNDYALFPESMADYPNQSNLFMKTVQEQDNDLRALGILQGYSMNLSDITNSYADADGDGEIDCIDVPQFRIDNTNWTMVPINSKTSNRLPLAQGLSRTIDKPHGEENAVVVHLAIDVPPNTRLTSHSVGLRVYLSPDIDHNINDAMRSGAGQASEAVIALGEK